MTAKQSSPSEGTTTVGRKPGTNGRGGDTNGKGSAGSAVNGVGREQVAEIQRARMLTAMVQEISERGAANVSVAHVVGRSGVSRRTFYEIFKDREDCYLAAFDDALHSVAAIVLPACEESGSWQARIRAALTTLLETLERDPATARLLIVESLAAGPRALERRRRVLAQIIPVIEQGRSEGRAADNPPALTAEGIAGGVLSVLHGRLTETNQGSLLDLLGPLMGMIVLPYLGPAVSRKEVERPAPQRPARTAVVHSDPLQGLPMRFTYRTMRVLMSVAEQPGASNRTIGERAGIGDQGQASKLLARLHKLGLIENRGGDPARGEPNAWMLTDTGSEVYDSIASLEARAG
ncbi:MAG TPA: TetR family transcriptional regulator [Solirubrobacteraceae bacterium]|jgi:AcrR family transcriptional regulator/DNA-binding MarR family transcriptional regulator|nr:TetR family transcriptional regulator [Solirubrobacteraceae bacterium]